MKRYFRSVILLMMVIGFTEVDVVKNSPEISFWRPIVALVVILLPFSYLVSFKARTFIDKLLDVKNPTSPKRWTGACCVQAANPGFQCFDGLTAAECGVFDPPFPGDIFLGQTCGANPCVDAD